MFGKGPTPQDEMSPKSLRISVLQAQLKDRENEVAQLQGRLRRLSINEKGLTQSSPELSAATTRQRSNSVPIMPQFNRSNSSPTLKRRASLHLKDACVLFCDIVGYTHLHQHVDFQTIHRIVTKPLFGEFDTKALSLGIEKVKENGDGYIAMYRGKGVTSKDDLIFKMVRFGLEMYQSLNDLNRQLADDDKWQQGPIQIRVGLHCGPCLELINAENYDLEDVVGNTPILASRMESSATPGTIQMTAEVFKHVSARFPFAKEFSIKVKGLEGEQSVFRIAGDAQFEPREESMPSRPRFTKSSESAQLLLPKHARQMLKLSK